MPGESWLPTNELRVIFRHLVITIAIAAAVWVATKAFIFLDPDIAEFANLIDQVEVAGVLVILVVKLWWEFARAGGSHAFAVA